MGPLRELGVGTGELFDAIAGLVEKSLIATRIDETQAQYRLLDTTRAYALEKLEEHAEVDVVFRRHAEYERKRRTSPLYIQEDCRSDVASS